MNLPFDLIFEITTFCNNKESFYIAIASKEIFKGFKTKKGFAKYLTYDNQMIIMNFIYKLDFHSISLNSISISRLENPQYWLNNVWVKTMFFDNCSFTDEVNPRYPVETEYIYINSKSKKMKINMKKFPKLRRIITC